MRTDRRRLIRLCLPLAVAVATLTVAASALAVAPGANGRLALVQSGSLVTMDADGTGATVVPTPVAPDVVRWSPNGDRIAFTGYDSGAGERAIWTVRPDGSDPQKIVVVDSTAFAWSPDGLRIVYSRNTPDGLASEVVIRDLASGTETVVLEPGVDTAPYLDLFGDGSHWYVSVSDWSPDGRYLALSGSENNDSWIDIVRLDLTDGSVLRLTTSPLFGTGFGPNGFNNHGNYTPRISPSGTTVLFNCWPGKGWNYHGEICTVPLAGGSPSILSRSLPLSPRPSLEYTLTYPTYSPDGTQVVHLREDYSTGGDRISVVTSAANLSTPTTIGAAGVYYFGVDWGVPAPVAPPADADGDGVIDTIDTGAGSFDDGAGTTGSIVNRNGLTVSVTDAPAPSGVRIVVGAGAGQATLSVCGFTLALNGGSDATITCGSITAQVTTGQGQVTIGAAVVRIPAGATARITRGAGDAFTIDQVAGGAVTVTIRGNATSVPAGQSATFGARPLIAQEVTYVRSLAKPAPVQASLIAPLLVADGALVRSRPAVACVSVAAFSSLAKAYSGRQLTAAQSTRLVADAARIRAFIGC